MPKSGRVLSAREEAAAGGVLGRNWRKVEILEHAWFWFVYFISFLLAFFGGPGTGGEGRNRNCGY